MFKDNMERIKDIEAARWFVISRNNKRIKEVSDTVFNKLRKVYDSGFKTFLCMRQGNVYQFRLSNDSYGFGVSTGSFDVDKDFKFTSFHGFEQELADEYFEYETFSRYLWSKNASITSYLREAITRKYSNDWYKKRIENVVLTINERIYVLTSRDGFSFLIRPEEQFNSVRIDL